VGKLAGLDWSMGVALSSSSCPSLLMPYVRLVFKIAGPDGVVSSRAVELSHGEFEVRRKDDHLSRWGGFRSRLPGRGRIGALYVKPELFARAEESC
jgi:hypothetical protein